MHNGSGLHKNTPPVAFSTRCVGIARLRDKYFPASNALRMFVFVHHFVTFKSIFYKLMHLDLVQREGQSKEFFGESSPKLLLFE